jgi:protein gp37
MLIDAPGRTHVVTIPFVPVTLNKLMGMNRMWRGSHKRKETRAIVYEFARAGIPKARGKRRVSQRITLVGRDRERDDDGAWKVLLGRTHVRRDVDRRPAGVGREDAPRIRAGGRATATPASSASGGDNGTRVVASEAAWREPLKWDRAAAKAGERHRVFCASLADVFEDRPELVEPRRRLARLIWETPNLDWLLLTKRPENAADMIYRMWFPDAEWPKNYWLGTSIEDQATADARIPHLLRAPAAVRFLSMEPLLGPVDLFKVPRPDNSYFRWRGETGAIGPKDEPDDFVYGSKRGIHWVIVGGESGPGARPFDLASARSIVAQCKAAGVPVFVKQLGAVPIGHDGEISVIGAKQYPFGNGAWRRLADKKGGDIAEWPADLRVRELPTTAEVATR